MNEVKLVAFELFGGCNFSCDMCPQATGRDRDFVKKLPFDVFCRVLEEAKERGCETVSLHGSGEATLHPEMPKFVRKVKELGLQCMTVSNGYLLNEKLSYALVEAGIDNIRISGIGYDRETYKQWMKKDAFDLVRENALRFKAINTELGGTSKLTLYHLILDQTQVDTEVELYRRNWVDYCEAEAEIWMMHNWSGTYNDSPFTRTGPARRTCGRPRAPQLNVRAGGLDGHSAAVVPCCFVLGRDREAVLGHLDTQSIGEVLDSQEYAILRQKHDEGDFDAISYCKDCDQLYDMPETLVWSNISGKSYGQSKARQDLDFRQFATKA